METLGEGRVSSGRGDSVGYRAVGRGEASVRGGRCGRVTGGGVEAHVWVPEGWRMAGTEVSAAVGRAGKAQGCEH